jgi:hypothetical protein
LKHVTNAAATAIAIATIVTATAAAIFTTFIVTTAT